MYLKKLFVLLSFFFSFLSAYPKPLSPLDFGLKDALTGEDRWAVLYKTHELAIKTNKKVSYRGIKTIDITIPYNAVPIPLSSETDFSGVTINVSNFRVFGLFLFELSNESTPAKIDDIKCFTNFNFHKYPYLREGKKLLLVEDSNPWVKNREGRNYGAIRRDVLLLENGKSINRPVYSYDNQSSRPSCEYVEVNGQKKVISNLTVNRTEKCNQLTFIIKVKNENNILLDKITINTQAQSHLYGDQAISIENCTNVQLREINIPSTYSKKDTYGYGITLNTIWNANFNYIHGKGAWGFFGNNNINKVLVKNSILNRFDLHCYGRDFCFENCKFEGPNNALPLSSMYGRVLFNKCEFSNTIPIGFRPDYNAYTPFDICFDRCTIYANSANYCLVHITGLNDIIAEREELRKKCIPNLKMKKCKVFIDDEMKRWEIFHMGNVSYKEPFEYISSVDLGEIKLMDDYREIPIIIFDNQVRTSNNLRLIMPQ